MMMITVSQNISVSQESEKHRWKFQKTRVEFPGM